MSYESISTLSKTLNLKFKIEQIKQEQNKTFNFRVFQDHKGVSKIIILNFKKNGVSE